MAIALDHVVVPSRDPVEAARRLAGLLGVPWDTPADGPFTPVYVNESLTLDFARWEPFEGHHLCFRVSDGDFDAIFGRLQASGIPYRSTPRGSTDMKINRRLGGKNVYWQDPDGHLWEILTVSYARAESPTASA
ncbi:MAG TPA: VOC family protein [Candidatus Limnocylindrales bacterium]|nr:VOC family protein [Candidatus Limnocylindrales bacterium]